MKRISSLIIFAFALASCNKDDSVLFSYTDLGDVVGNVITTDNGIRLNIVDSSCEPISGTVQRIVFSCNATNKISDTEYDVELLSWVMVLKKDAIRTSEITDQDAMGHDAISVTRAWFSGDYLNMTLITSFVMNSGVTHYINLELEEDKSDDKTLTFRVRHNANGDSYGPGAELPQDKYSLSSTYLSSPIKSLFPAGKSSVDVVVGWDWHITAGGTLEPGTEYQTLKGTVYLGQSAELNP